MVTAADAQASRTPVAAYSLDAGEGAVAEDVAGEHDGAIEGPDWFENGRYGSALSFDSGEEDCVTVADAPDLQLTEEFTLQAWVRPADPGDYEPLIYKESEDFFSYALYLGFEESGKVEGLLGSEEDEESEEPVPEVESDHALTAKVWAHVALTFDGAKLRLYVNGELQDTAYADAALPSTGPLTIGCADFLEFEDFYDGLIDEVRIYNRALSDAEIDPDLTPPTWPRGIEAVYEPEEEDTEVTWAPSSDPPSSDGRAGSGVPNYSYQHKVNNGSWSKWETTFGIAFSVPGTSEGDTVRVKLIARDGSGNVSPLRAARLITLPTEVSPEDPGEEAPNETGDARMHGEPAYLAEMFEEEGEFSLLEEFEEKLCGVNGSPCGKYNGRDAAAYALRWNLTDMGQEEARRRSNFNFDYFGGQGGDCTNYISQSLYNGGMRFMRANGVNDPDARNIEDRLKFERGHRSWWSYWYLESLGAFAHREYEVTESWVRAEKIRAQLLESGMGRVLGPKERFKIGDIIIYNLHGVDMSEANHSQIVVGVGKNKVWVAQHSPGYVQTFKRIINRNNSPDHKLNEDWKYQVIRPVYTAANIP